MTQEINRMNLQDYIIDALEIVSAWDLPEEAMAAAINDQVRLMVGIDPEDIREHSEDTH